MSVQELAKNPAGADQIARARELCGRSVELYARFEATGLTALSHAVTVGPSVLICAPAVVSVLVYQLVRRYSTKPWTYTAKLDEQLAHYEPVSLDAYRQLQERTRNLGSLETDFVLDWLEKERRAVELAAGFRKPEAKGFLHRKV